MPNSRPVLANLPLVLDWRENDVNRAPQLLFADAALRDADDNFAGGSLMLQGLAAGDIVSVRDVGQGVGQIGFDGQTATFGGVAFATVAGGEGAAFEVSFNGAATTAAVEALLANLTFQTFDDAPTFQRRFDLRLEDAAGAVAQSPS